MNGGTERFEKNSSSSFLMQSRFHSEGGTSSASASDATSQANVMAPASAVRRARWMSAIWAAMTSNFFLNNMFTYGDQRLRGARMWRGLASFYVACGIGALINLAIAEWLYLQSLTYWAAGLTGALIAALWNFFTTASFTWGGSEARKP